MTDITTTLNACKLEIAERYAAQVRRLHTNMVAALGPELRGVFNSWDWARIFNGTVRQYVTAGHALEEARLSIGAAAYADAVVAEWQSKILAKLGELENTDVQ